jgi:hypothetical protein
MTEHESTSPLPDAIKISASPDGLSSTDSETRFKLSRWLVAFSSGREWYPVGEYVAVSATSAIERAIAVFGCAADYRAEEIPWDAAPLPRMPIAPIRHSGQ